MLAYGGFDEGFLRFRLDFRSTERVSGAAPSYNLTNVAIQLHGGLGVLAFTQIPSKCPGGKCPLINQGAYFVPTLGGGVRDLGSAVGLAPGVLDDSVWLVRTGESGYRVREVDLYGHELTDWLQLPNDWQLVRATTPGLLLQSDCCWAIWDPVDSRMIDKHDQATIIAASGDRVAWTSRNSQAPDVEITDLAEGLDIRIPHSEVGDVGYGIFSTSSRYLLMVGEGDEVSLTRYNLPRRSVTSVPGGPYQSESADTTLAFGFSKFDDWVVVREGDSLVVWDGWSKQVHTVPYRPADFKIILPSDPTELIYRI